MIIRANMKKVLTLTIVALVLFGLFTLAVNHYIKPAPTTVSIGQYNQAKDDLDTQKAINNVQMLGYKSQIESLTKQKEAVCNQLKISKVVFPASLCQ